MDIKKSMTNAGQRISQCRSVSEFRIYCTVYSPDYHRIYKLQEDEKASWLEALLNGKYPQTKGHLRDDKGYCCLGVKCEIDPRVSDIGTNADNTHIYQYLEPFSQSQGTLPSDYADLLGISSKGEFYYTFNAHSTTYGKRCSLVELNDDGFTFTQIADIINYFF